MSSIIEPGSGRVLRVAKIMHDSVTDGPGLRYVVFVQGCPHRCPGCHNPETHDPRGGTDMPVDDILKDLRRNPLQQGVTFSGGEPFDQAAALICLAEGVKKMGLSLWIYTGYLWEQLQTNKTKAQLCALADVVIDGAYIAADHRYDLPWRGSGNQRLIDVKTMGN